MATLAQDNVITSAGLAPAPTIKTVPQPQDTTNYAGITGGVTESIISDYTNLNNRLNTGESQQTGTAQGILDVMGELTGKTAFSQSANESAGVNKETENLNRYAQQLADLNAQATSLNREAQAIPLQIQEQNRNTGATDRGVAPQEAGALRLNALRALSIGQQSDIAAAAATGSQLRLQAAKDKAQQMVDLKYKPLEEALAIKQKQYELNKDILTSIDKKRTEALTVSLNKEAKDLEEAKAKEKAIQDILTTAGIQQAPQDLLARAQKAKTPSEAAMILGQYAGDFYKTELLKQQIQTEKAQRAKIYADMDAKAQALTGQVFDASSLQNATKNLKLTESQSKALAFGQRAVNADKAMRERLQTYDPTTIFSATGRLLRTDNARAFERDLGDFITAVLRKESGATITPDEFERFIPLYSPQGILTNQKDVEQTNVKRNAAIDALISEAGPASAALTAYKSTVGKINTDTASNPFGQALGKNNQTILGTSIVDKVSDDGSIMFTIPK